MNKKPETTDQALISAFEQGNQEAGDSLYKRYYPILTGFCEQYLGDVAESQDIAQDVLCEIFVNGKINQFDKKSSFWAWIRDAAIFHCEHLPQNDCQYLADVNPEVLATQATTEQKPQDVQQDHQRRKTLTTLFEKLRRLYPPNTLNQQFRAA